MDKEQINKIEEIIERHLFGEEITERHLFGETNNSDYELKKMDVIIKYLIYQQLKELNDNLSLIDEALSSSE